MPDFQELMLIIWHGQPLILGSSPDLEEAKRTVIADLQLDVDINDLGFFYHLKTPVDQVIELLASAWKRLPPLTPIEVAIKIRQSGLANTWSTNASHTSGSQDPSLVLNIDAWRKGYDGHSYHANPLIRNPYQMLPSPPMSDAQPDLYRHEVREENHFTTIPITKKVLQDTVDSSASQCRRPNSESQLVANTTRTVGRQQQSSIASDTARGLESNESPPAKAIPFTYNTSEVSHDIANTSCSAIASNLTLAQPPVSFHLSASHQKFYAAKESLEGVATRESTAVTSATEFFPTFRKKSLPIKSHNHSIQRTVSADHLSARRNIEVSQRALDRRLSMTEVLALDEEALFTTFVSKKEPHDRRQHALVNCLKFADTALPSGPQDRGLRRLKSNPIGLCESYKEASSFGDDRLSTSRTHDMESKHPAYLGRSTVWTDPCLGILGTRVSAFPEHLQPESSAISPQRRPDSPMPSMSWSLPGIQALMESVPTRRLQTLSTESYGRSI